MFVLAALLSFIIPFVQKSKGWTPQRITKTGSTTSNSSSLDTVDEGEEIAERVWVV